jgi:hypothetical protein
MADMASPKKPRTISSVVVEWTKSKVLEATCGWVDFVTSPQWQGLLRVCSLAMRVIST